MECLSMLDGYPYVREVPAGQRPAGSEKEMYIVLRGAFEAFTMHNGSLVLAGVYNAGDSFGVRSYFGGGVREIFVAKEASAVCVVTKETFPVLARQAPDAVFSMLRDACGVMRVPDDPAVSAAVPPVAPAGDAGSNSARPPLAAKPMPVVNNVAAPKNEADSRETAKLLSTDFYPEGHQGYPGVTHPEYEKYIYAKELKCPNCYKSFMGKRIFQSKIVSAGEPRFDMRESFVDFKPEWYDVEVCPHCYFSVFSSYFLEPKGFVRVRLKDALAQTQKKVSVNFSAARDLDDVFASHYLALVCAEGFVNRLQLTARLWANLSWLYEDIEDKNMERFAASKAAEAYTKLYSETVITPVQEQTVCMTIAGMLYRAGEMKDIKKWLFQVKTNQGGKRLYADMADRLMDVLKQEGN